MKPGIATDLITAVSVLNLQENDTLIVRLGELVDADTAERIRAAWTTLAKSNRVVVLQPGQTLEILRGAGDVVISPAVPPGSHPSR